MGLRGLQVATRIEAQPRPAAGSLAGRLGCWSGEYSLPHLLTPARFGARPAGVIRRSRAAREGCATRLAAQFLRDGGMSRYRRGRCVGVVGARLLGSAIVAAKPSTEPNRRATRIANGGERVGLSCPSCPWRTHV